MAKILMASIPLSVAGIYERHLQDPRAMTPHLHRLRELADGLEVAVEFGVKHGASSSALLMGAKRVIGYDIQPSPLANALKEAAGGRWEYRIQDSRTADFESCDLLFVDSNHTYEQVSAELVHADRTRRYLVAHDVMTFGNIGSEKETGAFMWWPRQPCQEIPREAWGIRLAFDELMIRDPTWFIKAIYPDSHGLLVLERRA